jgi:hypothetical protein
MTALQGNIIISLLSFIAALMAGTLISLAFRRED